MSDQLLTRDEFREGVFARDRHTCVNCRKPGVDAHHIMERRLFPDGGYYLWEQEKYPITVDPLNGAGCDYNAIIQAEESKRTCGDSK